MREKLTFIPLYLCLSFVIAACSSMAFAKSESPKFNLPVNCQLNKDCWIVNYVDHDSSKNYADYQCGKRSYDGHRGTDFVIRNIEKMQQGVDVLAAADGKVIAVRDGESDQIWTQQQQQGTAGKECGNRVALNHGEGWVSDYCHMKKGSLRVHKDELVKRGQVIGQIGLSGKTEMPHVHFAVYKDGKFIDPFNAQAVGSAKCNITTENLWHDTLQTDLAYQTSSIFDLGFINQQPDFESIKKSTPELDLFNKEEAVMGLWGAVFGVAPGDRLQVNIYDPDGDIIVTYEQTILKYQARRYIFAGRKREGPVWMPGRYKGEVKLIKQTGAPDEAYTQQTFIEVR